MRLFMLLLLTVSAGSGAGDCQVDKQAVAIHYTVIHTDKDGKILEQKPIVLWRYREQVAVQYPETEITELWEQTPQQTLRLVRYFNRYRRGIEYQPGEINHGRGEDDWSLKRQLVSDDLINQLAVVASHREACGPVQELASKNNASIEMQWLADLKIMRAMKIQRQDGQTLWTQDKTTTDVNTVAGFFQALSSYQTTDYIDIGDNESDPFLAKMIHMGFVEHNHAESDGHPH